jgi:hypothetical protein
MIDDADILEAYADVDVYADKPMAATIPIDRHLRGDDDEGEKPMAETIAIARQRTIPPPPPTAPLPIDAAKATNAEPIEIEIEIDNDAAVDTLLRSSAPPPPPPPAYYAPPSVPQMRMPMQMRTPSVVPVTFPSTAPPPAHVATRSGSGGGAWMVAGLLAFAFVVVAGVISFALPEGTFAKIESAVRERVRPGEPAREVKVERTPVTATPAPAEIPSVPVSSLPKSTIEPDLTLVTFPPRAKGRRVYFDGVHLKRRGAQTMKLKCGVHTIKIGAMGKTSPVQLPCGGETMLL